MIVRDSVSTRKPHPGRKPGREGSAGSDLKIGKTPEALRLIGYDQEMLDRQFQVLRIILRKQQEQGVPVPFKDIESQIRVEADNRSVVRPQIYRWLTSLEKDGYLSVDRFSRPHRYSASVETLAAALSEARTRALVSLERERMRLLSDIQNLYVNRDPSDNESEAPDFSRLAGDTIELITGVRQRTVVRFAEGLEQINRLIDSEVYSTVRKRDVLRLSMGQRGIDLVTAEQHTKAVSRLANKGAIFRVLLSSNFDTNDRIGRLVVDTYRSLIQDSLDVSLKRRTRSEETYQMVARNSDRVVLRVSDEPIAATFIPRFINQELVDDAIASFDAEFAIATDVTTGTSDWRTKA